jgi:syntaxin 16
VHYSLAIKLRELTNTVKNLEKQHVDHMKMMVSKDDNDLENNDNLLDDFDDDLTHQQLEKKNIQNARNQEITDIVKSTEELAALFKELSVLVIEQGTVLDRIDYNIEDALTHSKKGRKHLVAAKKASESTRSRNVIL